VANSSQKKIVIIAPNPLLSAFRTLIQSAPTLDLLAAEASLSAICKLTEKKPDIVLTYLEGDCPSRAPEHVWSKKIEDLKEAWPGVYIIALISDPRRREEMRTSGVDKVLYEGITPAFLLASIEMVELQSNV